MRIIEDRLEILGIKNINYLELNSLIEDDNEFILTMNKKQIKTKRITIFKKGIGEVGSLSIDDISKYLNNEITKNDFGAGKYGIGCFVNHFTNARQHTII